MDLAAQVAQLQKDVAEMAHNSAELARQIAFLNPGHEQTLAQMACEMAALASRHALEQELLRLHAALATAEQERDAARDIIQHALGT
jgi:hypothetical protein